MSESVSNRQETVSLALPNLSQLPSNVSVPNYRRSQLTAGIVHFGIGNFHRAHQAVYLHKLFDQGIALDWAIIGAGVLDNDKLMQSALSKQDYLSTVVQQGPAQETVTVVGSMVDFCEVGNASLLLQKLCDPSIRIVTLTVTEGGYFIDATTGETDHSLLQSVEAEMEPEQLQSVFSYIVRSLARRRSRGIDPYTVVSCDNIPHNGNVTRATVVACASLIDTSLATWIETHVAFPNAMVDCITPATSLQQRQHLSNHYGIQDRAPVFCEQFQQWVLEDNFTNGRPPLEEVGVQFVTDVSPYETMKIRILNGGHAALAYAAALLDIKFAHDAVQDETLNAYLKKLLREEVIPLVPAPPSVDLLEYTQSVLQRFANEHIADTITRLCFDGSNRQPKFIIPSINDALARQYPMEGLALASALWCRYCSGVSESGIPIESNDPKWWVLTKCSSESRHNPRVWLQMTDIYGPLANSDAFVSAFSNALTSLWKTGARATLDAYIRGEPIQDQ